MLYGFSCINVGCKVNENYIEYLNCPTVDFAPCDTIDCQSTPETILCVVPDIPIVTNVTINSATVSFVPPIHPYTVYLSIGLVIVDQRENPTSPINYTGLTPDTEYTVTLINHCAFGEDRSITANFHTLLACADIVGITAIGEDVPDF